MAKKKKEAAAPAKASKRKSTAEILKEYSEPTYFKVKLLGDRYYDHYLHRAGATIVMLIDPALRPPQQIRILGEASPVDEDEDEGEDEGEKQERGGSDENENI